MRYFGFLFLALQALCQTPAVLSILPADGATNVPLNARPMVSHTVFSMPPEISVALVQGGSAVQGLRIQAPNFKRPWALFLPDSRWAPSTEYEVTVTQAGQLPVRSRFTTGTGLDSTPLRAVATEPADGASGVPAKQPFRIRFNKPVDPTSLDGSVQPTGFNLFAVGSSFSRLSNSAFGLEPDGVTVANDDTSFDYATVYYLRFPDPGPRDWAGNTLDFRPNIYFSTHTGGPADGPRVLVSHPADGETGVPLDALLSLRFDRSVFSPPPASSVQVRTSTGQTVRVDVHPIALDAIQVRPLAGWTAGETYQWTVSGFSDLFGVPMRQTYSASFQIGRSSANQTVGWAARIAPTVAGNARPMWRSVLPVSEVVPPVVTVYPANGSPAPPQEKLRAMVSPDGTTLSLDRESLPARGTYRIGISARDRYQLNFLQTEDRVTFDTENDSTPPVYFVDPPDNAKPEPPNVMLRIVSREPLYAVPGKSPVLRRGSETIPLSPQSHNPTLSDFVASWRPVSPLQPGEYEWDAAGLSDAAGNEISPGTYRFTVGSPPAEPFQLLAVQPANDAVDVPPSAPLVFTFNRTPNAAASGVSAYLGVGTGDWSFSGVTATFRPSLPWRERSIVRWTTGNFQDPFSRTVTGTPNGSFRVSRTGAPRALEVARIEPAAGSAIDSGRGLDVQFSHAVLFTEAAFSLRADDRPVPFSASYDERTFRARILPGVLPPGATGLALYISSEIVDDAGNRLTPFAARFPLNELTTPAPAPPGPPQLLDFSQAGPFTPAHPVVVYLRPAAAAEMVAKHVRIDVDDAPAEGTFSWTADNRAFTFRPAAPWRDRATVSVKLSYASLGIPSGEVHSRTVAAPRPLPAPGLLPPIVARNYQRTFPMDGVIEIYFADDLAAGTLETLTASAAVRFASPPDKAVLTITQPAPRILRLRPDGSFRGGVSYDIEIKAGDRIAFQELIGVATATTRAYKEFSAGPTAAMGRAPVNVLIRAGFDTLVNPETVRPILEGGGHLVPLDPAPEYPDALSCFFRPVGLLQPNTEYRVTLTGLADMAGRPIPDQSWTFTTGDGPDRTGFRALRVEPAGLAAVTSRPQVLFDKPVFPRAQDGFQRNPYNLVTFGDSPDSNGFRIRLSDDGRTAEYVPARNWPEGSAIDGTFRALVDWTGAPANIRPLQAPVFTERVDGSRPVQISAWNPANGAAETPRNVLVQVRFDGYPADAALAALELWAEGQQQKVVAVRSADGRVVTLRPETALASRVAYTVRFQGATLSSFTTGVEMDVKPLSLHVDVPAAPSGALFRITAGKPLNPALVPDAPAELRIANAERLAARFEWSADRREILVFAATPLPGGARPSLTLAPLADWTGFGTAGGGPFFSEFPLSAAHAPKAIQRVPEAGSIVPATTPIQLLFDDWVSAEGPDSSLRLWESGREIPVERTGIPRVDGVAIRPRLPLFPGESYEVEVAGVQGSSGLIAATVRWKFTTQPAGRVDLPPLQSVSTQPPDRAVGVPVDQVVSLTFNRPVYPENAPSVYSSTRLFDPQPVTRADGAALILTPRPSWPAGGEISLSASVSDYSGNRANRFLTFTTAPSADTVPPRVESMTPEEGVMVAPGRVLVSVVFSEPVLVSSGGFRIEINGRADIPDQPFALDAERRRWALVVPLNPGSSVKISTTAFLTDLSGNRLTPFTRTFRVSEVDLLAPPLAAVTAPIPQSTIEPETRFELRFQVPMNEATTRDAIRVAEEGVNVPLTAEAFEDGRIWRLTPLEPLRRGMPVEVRVENSALSAAGVFARDRMRFAFQVAAVASPGTMSSVAGYLAASGTVDVLFSGPAAVRDEPFGIRQGLRRIPVRIEKGGTRWLRFRPEEPLAPHVAYHLMLGPDEEIPFQLPLENEQPNPVVAPLGLLRMQRPAEMHPFDVENGIVEVFDDRGKRVAHSVHPSADGKELLLMPIHAPAGSVVRIRR
jgi:hypothetical protein